MSEKKPKYGLLPPFREPPNGIGHYVVPGHSLAEWRANRDKALEELLATFTPEELASYKRDLEELKKKRKKKR